MVRRISGKRIFESYPVLPRAQHSQSRQEVEKGSLNRLSVSKMQLFEKCPYAFKFYYIDGLSKLDESDALATGKLLHDYFYHASLSAYPESIRMNSQYSKFAKDCENFIDWSRHKMLVAGTFQPWRAELEIYDPELDVLLFIDRIDSVKDGYEVCDYKTGRVHDISLHRFQLALYAYFVEKHLNIKIKRWSIFFSGEGKYVGEAVIRSKIDMIPKTIEGVRQRINSAVKLGFHKKPGPLCGFCSFKQYSLCDAKGHKSRDYFGILDEYRRKG